MKPFYAQTCTNEIRKVMRKFTKLCLVVATIIFAAPNIYAQISVGISISARIAPPALPVYVQPACPTDGYLWQPGYWAYDQDANDYYWVPGVWIAPPNPGLLWTPCYWGYVGGVYGFHAGYWGPHVGFYGGVNYGGGYGGVGFIGGGWQGGYFRYNTAVVRVNTTVIHNTYVDRTVINNTTVVNNRSSFNGQGGVTAQPRPEELAAMKEQHVQPTSQQLAHQQTAHADKSQFASANHGQPTNAAMNRVNGSHFTPEGNRSANNGGNRNLQANNGGRNNPQPNINAAHQQQQHGQPRQQGSQPHGNGHPSGQHNNKKH